MLLLRNLTDIATITTVTVGARSGGHNNPTTTTSTATTPALFQQQSTAERLDSEDITTSRGVLFLPSGVLISPTSKVTLASLPDRSWRVVGDPASQVALGGRASHIEVLLEAITSS